MGIAAFVKGKAPSVTDAQIKAAQKKAEADEDKALAALCKKALDGDFAARSKVAAEIKG